MPHPLARLLALPAAAALPLPPIIKKKPVQTGFFTETEKDMPCPTRSTGNM
jgi:hypothetical protein